MKHFKTSLALLTSAALMAGCSDDDNDKTELQPTEVKIATYNLSFDRTTLDDLIDQMLITPAEQDVLVTAYLDDTIADDDKTTAEKVIQIRNVAAIIQKNRPDVLMLAEFNNDGVGEDTTALEAFQDNYLSVAQSIDGAGGEASLKPIAYPFAESYATNTGLLSGFDLNNDGYTAQPEDLDPAAYPNPYSDDSWGFGQYHGKYAFALMSKYEIDTANTRTFQEFKWKDMGAEIPTITICDDPTALPDNMECGDEWYTAEEWEEVRLSSKNHVDAPIIIPTENGNEVVHLLLSHPTPPTFDVGKNKAQNGAEVKFWHDYVRGEDYFYDDTGVTGGLANNAKFVMMGDQNLDPVAGDGISSIMADFHNDPLVHQGVTNGELYPISEGAIEHAIDNNKTHPFPERMTSTFGLGVDYAMPSANMTVIDSGVYWAASYEEGRLLFNDARVGTYGNGKDISSDHRMVWIKAQF